MTQHLSENTKYRITSHVLEGESFAKVAVRFGISKAGAAKIFNKMKIKFFPLEHERNELGIDMDDIESLRNAWKRVKYF